MITLTIIQSLANVLILMVEPIKVMYRTHRHVEDKNKTNYSSARQP